MTVLILASSSCIYFFSMLIRFGHRVFDGSIPQMRDELFTIYHLIDNNSG